MQEEIIEEYQKTPVFESSYLKAVVKLLGFILGFTPFIVGILFWAFTDWFYALAALLLSYLLSGIVSSKLRHFYIPFFQREFSYSSYELAAWVVAFYVHSKQDANEV